VKLVDEIGLEKHFVKFMLFYRSTFCI